MKRSALIGQARRDLDDIAKPYLVSDADMLDFLNEAQEEAARRARLLKDATTPACCRLSIAATRQYYPLHASVIQVYRFLPASRSTPLRKVSFHQLDDEQPGWVGRAGTPDRYCLDFESQKVWLNRAPTVADTVSMQVARLPLTPLDLVNDCEPEIHAAYHRPLVNWMLYKGYNIRDSDLYNETLAAKHLSLFTETFGEESTAIEEEHAREQYGDERDGER